jgi:hypothetical protein
LGTNKKFKQKPIKPSAQDSASKMKPLPVNENGVLTFSFKHLQLSHPDGKFCIKNKDGSYLFSMLNRLKDVSTIRTTDFRSSGGSALRAHKIEWKQTSEKDGFSHLNDQLQLATPFQFQISANEHGRIHGFLIGDIFYAVWFDPTHQLYP